MGQIRIFLLLFFCFFSLNANYDFLSFFQYCSRFFFKDETCYLAQLPKDAQNKIAYYLIADELRKKKHYKLENYEIIPDRGVCEKESEDALDLPIFGRTQCYLTNIQSNANELNNKIIDFDIAKNLMIGLQVFNTQIPGQAFYDNHSRLLIKTRDSSAVEKITLSKTSIKNVAISPDGQKFFGISIKDNDSKNLCLYDKNNGKWTEQEIKLPYDTICQMGYFKQINTLALLHNDENITIVKLDNKSNHNYLEGYFHCKGVCKKIEGE